MSPRHTFAYSGFSVRARRASCRASSAAPVRRKAALRFAQMVWSDVLCLSAWVYALAALSKSPLTKASSPCRLNLLPLVSSGSGASGMSTYTRSQPFSRLV